MSQKNVRPLLRLDQYVSSHLPENSRAFAAKLISQGGVRINGDAVLKAGYKIRPSDNIVITPLPNKLINVEKVNVPILYEDDDCVVINKPPGLLTHSKGNFNPEPTVASWLSSRITKMSGERAGIVHRLDRATSGVMICAKTPEAMNWLQKQFSLRKVRKTYVAVVEGIPTMNEAIIDMPIERNPKKPQTFRVGSNGKAAATTYKVLKSSSSRSLVELRPSTGRTHQLRVHLAYIKHPIIGDTYYRGLPAKRMMLHAKDLEITLPSRQRKIFSSRMPREFKV